MILWKHPYPKLICGDVTINIAHWLPAYNAIFKASSKEVERYIWSTVGSNLQIYIYSQLY